jgi:hypothetical protein
MLGRARLLARSEAAVTSAWHFFLGLNGSFSDVFVPLRWARTRAGTGPASESSELNALERKLPMRRALCRRIPSASSHYEAYESGIPDGQADRGTNDQVSHCRNSIRSS